MRNPDGSETQVEAFDLKDGALVPYRGFGKDGILTIKEKMVFGMTVDSDNNVYYVKKESTLSSAAMILQACRETRRRPALLFCLGSSKPTFMETIILPWLT